MSPRPKGLVFLIQANFLFVSIPMIRKQYDLPRPHRRWLCTQEISWLSRNKQGRWDASEIPSPFGMWWNHMEWTSHESGVNSCIFLPWLPKAKLLFLWTWKVLLWLNQPHRIHGTGAVDLPAFEWILVYGKCKYCRYTIHGSYRNFGNWRAWDVLVAAVASGPSSFLILQYSYWTCISYPLYALFFPCLLSISTLDFFLVLWQQTLCFVFFPQKRSVFNAGVLSKQIAAFKDMSQGSQVPIPEEANALQSFMQNNVTWNAVKNDSEWGRWVGKHLRP